MVLTLRNPLAAEPSPGIMLNAVESGRGEVEVVDVCVDRDVVASEVESVVESELTETLLVVDRKVVDSVEDSVSVRDAVVESVPGPEVVESVVTTVVEDAACEVADSVSEEEAKAAGGPISLCLTTQY